MREHFRGVIFNKTTDEQAAAKNYRYMVVGLLITDKPLDLESTSNLDGYAAGMADVVQAIKKVKLPGHKHGDASSILTSVDTWDFIIENGEDEDEEDDEDSDEQPSL